MNRLVVAFAAALSLGVTCGPAAGPPPPDSCSSPQSKSFTSVELGPEMLPMRDFEAWNPEDTAYITEGAQGGHMLAFSLHLSGDAPACITQKTVVTVNGNVVAEQTSPLKTYDAGDGTRITKTGYCVYDEPYPPLGSTVVVTTTTGGKTSSATLNLVTDRNLLESLTVLTQSPHVGYPIDFQLKSRHAPAYTGFNVTTQVSNPSVLSASPPMYIYDDSTTFQGSAYSAGSATVTVKLGTQSVMVPVTVIP